MKRTVGMMVKVALVGASVGVMVWLGASIVDTVSHNTGDRRVLYMEGQYIEEDPFADWNMFTILSNRG